MESKTVNKKHFKGFRNEEEFGYMAGHIGRKVIQIAQALEMNILVYTRTPREDEKGIRYVSLMKPSAFIINTSRRIWKTSGAVK